MAASTEIGKYQLLPAVAANVAGVRHGQRFICEEIFPPLQVDAEEFRRELDGNEGMLDIPNLERAMDADSAEVDMDTDFVDESLSEISVKTKVDYRKIRAAQHADILKRAMGSTGIGLSSEERLIQRRAIKLSKICAIHKEKRAAAIAFATGSYESALRETAIDWDSADLISEIEEKRWLVHDMFGVFFDTIVLGKTALKSVLSNATLLDRIEMGGTPADPALIGLDTIAKMFRVARVLPASAVTQAKALPGAAGASTDIWTPDVAIAIYTGLDLRDPVLGAIDEDDDVAPVFGRTYYANVPETGVRFNVGRWATPNNKIHYVEVTEFADPKQVLKAGAIWTNTDQA